MAVAAMQGVDQHTRSNHTFLNPAEILLSYLNWPECKWKVESCLHPLLLLQAKMR